MPARVDLEDLAGRVAALEADLAARPRCGCNGCRDQIRERELAERRARADEILAGDDRDVLAALYEAGAQLRRDVLGAMPKDRAIRFGVALSDHDLAVLRSAFDVWVVDQIDAYRAPREHHVIVEAVDKTLDWQRSEIKIKALDWCAGLRHQLRDVARSIEGDQAGVYHPLCWTPTKPRHMVIKTTWDAMLRFDRELAKAVADGTITARECTDAEDFQIARTNARTTGAMR